MFLHFPDFLETFATKLAGQLFFVDLSLFPIVNVLDVCSNVVTIQESLPTNIAGIIPFAGVALHMAFQFRLGMSSESANGTHDIFLLFMHE